VNNFEKQRARADTRKRVDEDIIWWNSLETEEYTEEEASVVAFNEADKAEQEAERLHYEAEAAFLLADAARKYANELLRKAEAKEERWRYGTNHSR
jgi:membrane protein involved in colicin uptake